MDEYEEISEQESLEHYRTILEHEMINLPEETRKFHKSFLAGFIDCLFDSEQINENIRETLYLEYAE